jgi:integrase
MPLSQWTIHTRSSEISVLLELIGELPELDFKKYNVNTIPVFGEVLIKRKYGDFVESFLQKLIEKKYDDSTIYKYISTLRQSTFFVLHENALYTGDLLSKLKYKRPNYEVETITTEQAKFILDNYPRIRMECRTLQQQYALQYWITALLLSPRISDMKSWTRNNIFKVDGETWIKYYAQKTQNSNPFPIEVPVPEMLMPIFNRNILEFRGKLLPPMNSAINEKLETIAKRYQIFHNDVIRRRKKGGKPITKVMKGWQQVHIHMMRATAITLFVEDGMPESVVKGFSGHTTDSQSFRRYVKISNGAKKKYYNQFQNNLLASI